MKSIYKQKKYTKLEREVEIVKKKEVVREIAERKKEMIKDKLRGRKKKNEYINGRE